MLQQRKILIGLAVLAAIAMLSRPCYAEEPTSQTNAHLKKWLEKYPEADLNGDGILTASEVWLFQADKAKMQKAEQARAKRERLSEQAKQASQAPQGEVAAAPPKARRRPARPKPDYANVKYGPDERNVLGMSTWPSPIGPRRW